MEKNSRLLDIIQAAEFLGIPIWTIRGMVRQRKIPIVRLNRRILFDKAKLETWIQEHSLEPIDHNLNKDGF
jgi:excisionase family DNA binding protein